MMRRKFLGLSDAELNFMMTEVCGTTSCIMMEVGGGTISTLSNSVR